MTLKGETSYKDTKKVGPAPKKCIILIDGSNFYHKLKDLSLNNLLSFKFDKFARYLSGKYLLTSSTYFGKIKTDGTPKSQELFTHQRKLLAHLKKHGFNYSLGYLMKSGGKYHEKGVDVNIAVDILVATYENSCDHIILISSDTDLLPAILKAKEKGKTVEYVGFSHKPSVAMVANSSESRLLKTEELEKFIQEQKNPAKVIRRRRSV